MTEEAIEFFHDRRPHDLSEEGVLLSQLLGTEVLPTARGPLVVVEEVNEGRVGGLGEQLLVDVGEEPAGGGGRCKGGLNMGQDHPHPAPAGAARQVRAGMQRWRSGAESGPQLL